MKSAQTEDVVGDWSKLLVASLIGAKMEITGSPRLTMFLSLAAELIQAISHEVSANLNQGPPTDPIFLFLLLVEVDRRPQIISSHMYTNGPGASY
jgi:hypothetical protein